MTIVASKFGRLTAMFERMSDRERKLVIGAVAALTVTAIVATSVLITSRVNALREEVESNEAALKDIETAGPRYLALREEEKLVDSQLERAGKEPLEAKLLAVAKEIKYTVKDEEGNSIEKSLENPKCSGHSEVLAELTVKAAKKPAKKKKAKKGKEVFLSTIDVTYTNVPDDALLRLLSKLETHPEPMFGLTIDITRNGTSRDQMQATIKIGQFRYGQLEE